MKFLAIIALSATLLFGVIDINKATKEELVTLKGVGEKKATAILAFRKGHCFTSVDDLTSVKGIGPKFIQKNRKNLKAGKCKSKGFF
ncbi:MAG: helix-hairpin-helix domain-containing protein [Campylobacterota bacterium]|nr:helix-hairpin-helix domain-containing protein [Campylobacterota bacterium]